MDVKEGEGEVENWIERGGQKMPIAMPFGLAAAFGATEVNYERRTQHFRAGREGRGRGGAAGVVPIGSITARVAFFVQCRVAIEPRFTLGHRHQETHWPD